jgi:hypothetical protein
LRRCWSGCRDAGRHASHGDLVGLAASRTKLYGKLANNVPDDLGSVSVGGEKPQPGNSVPLNEDALAAGPAAISFHLGDPG